jgi:hypothetical protein
MRHRNVVLPQHYAQRLAMDVKCYLRRAIALAGGINALSRLASLSRQTIYNLLEGRKSTHSTFAKVKTFVEREESRKGPRLGHRRKGS